MAGVAARYGEVTYVAKSWRRAIERLDERGTLVLNADDPSVAALGRGAPGRSVVSMRMHMTVCCTGAKGPLALPWRRQAAD